MNRKRTPHDFALWAALPMAHTSRIESRLTRILDSTRRRTLPRRALVFSVAIGAAALIPLAMLRPVAKAQTAPVTTNAIQLVGIADASALSGPAWDQAGNVLHTPIFQPFIQSAKMKISALPGQKALFVAFHIPAPLRQNPRIVVNSSDASTGDVVMTSSNGSIVTASGLQMQLFDGPVIYMTGFPAALPSANFLVGVASGPGTETIDCPKTTGKVNLQRPAGEVIFTLISNPHGLPSAQATRGKAVFMVSDHFHSPSSLKADNPLQVVLHDGENYERTVYALDSAGRVIAELTGELYPGQDAYGRFKFEQLIFIPKPLLERIASFRLVAQPYHWTEFKNVALQPVK